MFNLLKKELQQLFFSPIAWVMMAVSQVILCYLFLIHLQDFIALQPQLKLLANPPGITQYMLPRLYTPAASIYLLLIPLLTMRLIADEFKQHTMALLFASPLSNSAIIVAKYLSVLLMILVMLSINSMMFLTLLWATPLDLISFAWAFTGTFLFISACAAAGLYFSCISKQPLTAAFATFGLLFLLWTLGLSHSSADNASGALYYLAIANHLASFMNGLVSLKDVLYYLLFIALFLLLSIYKLANSRSL